MGKNLQIIGHRGLPALYPENTLLSFTKAVETGVDAIEFDVHSTRDGKLVVTHDDTVDRCSNGHGAVHDLTFDEVRQLDFGAWKGAEFSGTQIPTLDEVLDAIFSKRPGMYLLIELKENDESCAKKVLETLRRREMIDNSLVLSFHPAMLALIRRLEPRLCLQGFPNRYLSPSLSGNYGLINKTCIWTREITAEELIFFHRQNITVDVCPVDDKKALEKILAFDIDSFTTNAAHVIMPLLREKGLR